MQRQLHCLGSETCLFDSFDPDSKLNHPPTEVVGIQGEPPTPRQPSSKVRLPSAASPPRRLLCAGMSDVTWECQQQLLA